MAEYHRWTKHSNTGIYNKLSCAGASDSTLALAILWTTEAIESWQNSTGAPDSATLVPTTGQSHVPV